MKKLLTLNWIAFASAFVTAEFFSFNQAYMWPSIAFVVWFTLAEGYAIISGHESTEADSGTTLSANSWKWIESGVKSARFLLVWLFCVSMLFRCAVVSAEYGGYLVPGELPYLLSQGPILLVFIGVAGWLFGHMWSLGKYGQQEGEE